MEGCAFMVGRLDGVCGGFIPYCRKEAVSYARGAFGGHVAGKAQKAVFSSTQPEPGARRASDSEGSAVRSILPVAAFRKRRTGTDPGAGSG